MKYTGGKTKVFFTLGIYIFFWQHSLFRNLREDFNTPVRSYWWMWVPIYSFVVWWQFLTTIKRTQQRVGMPTSLSVPRAFFLSPFWFGAVPYINRHVNALYTFRTGGMTAVAAAQTLGMMHPAPVPPATPGQVSSVRPREQAAGE